MIGLKNVKIKSALIVLFYFTKHILTISFGFEQLYPLPPVDLPVKLPYTEKYIYLIF